jgi:thymidylate synthase
MAKVVGHGVNRPDRTGAGTLSCFGEQLVFDNRPGTFPAVTTKRLFFGQVKAELACFLRGYDSLEQFHSMGCTIWDGNGNSDYWKPRARFEGDLGRIYGVQWRDWLSVGCKAQGGGAEEPKSTDQLRALVDGMRRDPYGRRHVVTALNPGELDQMCLPPCHVLFQAYVRPDATSSSPDPHQPGQWVDLRVDMRSVDLFLGLPFDVASYALLQRLLAKELGWKSGWLVFQLGDAHVYLNHLDQVKTVLGRREKAPPDLVLDPAASLFGFEPAHALLSGYDPHPPVAAPLNV